ncbi:LexA family transcriptional regulator [Paenibacillus senegalimassiliensis]|uniref:LexA family transcriptional regulator n=1 Tax=Paenibacillus senegalimassiliensis TaxID=1737426 RepID=UPI00073F7BA7|nr:LexA family transcriptional regulator [Paenibacillus senegalimassiliensis]
MARKKYSELELKAMSEASVNLKKTMRLRGINQTYLAEKTNIPTSTISDYVNGKTLISMGNLEKISEALHVYKSQLIPSLGQGERYHKDIPLIKSIRSEDGLLAEDNIDEYIHFPFRDDIQPDYAVRIADDTMSDFGINKGSVVFLRDAQWADRNGQIVSVISSDKKNGVLRKMNWEEGTPKIKLYSGRKSFEEKLPNQIKVVGIYMGHFSLGG